MGRPLKQAPEAEKQVESLAAINCSWAEIGAVLGMHESTARRRFTRAYKKGLELGKMSLRRKLWTLATEGKGHPTLLIWLSKQMLGYRDQPEIQQTIVTDSVQVFEAEWGATGEPTDPTISA